ncbi:MAG TPA: methyltransferase domain-containing protein [Candidatus Binataceae bacterium]|nr:methyltransferase domain-containing protein [Candidatus Binataceae bacterium]
MADDDPPLKRPARGNVAQYFGRIADSYGDGEYYIRRREAVVAALADEITKVRRILDAGCGNGRYLYDFRERLPNALAIGADLTAEMIAQARARNGADTPLLRADVTAAPFRDGVLDIIFASHVFQFVADKDATMRDLARCLRRGGAIILTVGGAGIRGAMRDLVNPEQWEQLANAAFPSRRAIVAGEREQVHRDAMIHAGLAVETREARFSVTWSGIVEWIDLRWGPFMSAEQRAIASRILDDVAPQLSSRTFDLVERMLIGRKPA